jgi:hypothetical protein
MKKRTNPKVEAMRDRSLMVESERQNHERNYSLNEPRRVSYDVMIHKLNMGREMGEPDLSQMVDEVITDGDNTSATGNRNTWPFK